jgi:hypothetical protein
MKDILTARLDMIGNSLYEIKNFAGLDTRRRTELEEIRILLEDQIKGKARILDGAIVTAASLIEDQRDTYEFSDPGLAQKLVDILAILKTAKDQSSEIMNHNKSAIHTIHSLINSRMAVQKTELTMIALNIFTNKGEDILKAIKSVREDIASAQNSPKEEADEHWKDAWQGYWENIHSPTQVLFGDYVDFMRGLATRDCKLDDEICQLADDLINKWKVQGVSLTIPVKYEVLEKTAVRIVRLSFQDWTAWALPMVAREVSYVIHASENGNEKINKYIKDQGEQAEADETLLRDILADIFAIYGMGPAYAYAAIYMHFEPIPTRQNSSNQTSDLWRAEAIFTMLEWVSKEKMKVDPYQLTCQTLRKEWKYALDQAGQAELNQKEKGKIVQWVTDLAEKIYDGDNLSLMFPAAQWDRAVEMKNVFLRDNCFPQISKASDDLRAILNAAWLVRDQDKPGISIDEIQKATKEAMEIISGRKLATIVQTNRQSTLIPV